MLGAVARVGTLFPHWDVQDVIINLFFLRTIHGCIHTISCLVGIVDFATRSFHGVRSEALSFILPGALFFEELHFAHL